MTIWDLPNGEWFLRKVRPAGLMNALQRLE